MEGPPPSVAAYMALTGRWGLRSRSGFTTATVCLCTWHVTHSHAHMHTHMHTHSFCTIYNIKLFTVRLQSGLVVLKCYAKALQGSQTSEWWSIRLYCLHRFDLVHVFPMSRLVIKIICQKTMKSSCHDVCLRSLGCIYLAVRGGGLLGRGHHILKV